MVITVYNEVVKVMFLHLSVILFTGGVYLSACWDTIPPGPGTHSGPVTPSPGPAPPPQQTATVADGMQPTGMHSCLMTVLSPNCHSAVQTQTQTEPEV